MVGFFSIWHGPRRSMPDFPDRASRARASQMKNPTTDKARLWQQQNRPKLNLVKLGYSRDGWSWAPSTLNAGFSRSCVEGRGEPRDRRPFITFSEDPKAWNFGNVQSVGGGLLIVGDRLYIYFSGRRAGETACDGVAFLRRDGFASMDADAEGGTLTTRPVSFQGKHLFVNVDDPKGELRVELLDEQGQVLAPYSREKCAPVSVDKTLQSVTWQGADDLSAVAGKPVRFRFHLKTGSLYAFWVSPDESGVRQLADGGGLQAEAPASPASAGWRIGMAAYEAAKVACPRRSMPDSPDRASRAH